MSVLIEKPWAMNNNPPGTRRRKLARVTRPANGNHALDHGPKRMPILWQTHLWTKPIHTVTHPHPVIKPSDILHLQPTRPRELSPTLKRIVRTETASNTSGDMTLRVADLQPMKRFYQDFLGFELLGEFPNAALLEITGSNGRPVQAIGLLKRPVHDGSKRNAGIHIVISFPPDDFETTKRRLVHFDVRLTKTTPDRICLQDPEGNQVEVVCRKEGGRSGGRRTGRRRNYR